MLMKSSYYQAKSPNAMNTPSNKSPDNVRVEDATSFMVSFSFKLGKWILFAFLLASLRSY